MTYVSVMKEPKLQEVFLLGKFTYTNTYIETKIWNYLFFFFSFSGKRMELKGDKQFVN